MKYRADVDGLRCYAVIAVILFHYGLIENGYLGVDVFFVISGFLITRIIHGGIADKKFSLIDFYYRRARRIVPLVVVASSVALLIGWFVMLPDDLENLAQSVIATSAFSNNILLLLTTGDYWDPINEFKPLMHTWSLGVEEQFYLLYPLLLILIGASSRKLIIILGAFLVCSLALFCSPFPTEWKFYLLPFRGFELLLGGVATLVRRREIFRGGNLILYAGILLLIFVKTPLPAELELVGVTFLSAIFLCTHSKNPRFFAALSEGRFILFLGKISFSLYVWHQIVLSFTRYFIVEELNFLVLLCVSAVVFLLSVATYFGVEKPFRSSKFIGRKAFTLVLLLGLAVSNGVAFHIYWKAGVVRDFPALDISVEDARRGVHAEYNQRIDQFSEPFASTDKVKVLLVGDSFVRDWCNVMIEAGLDRDCEFSYIYVKEHVITPEVRSGVDARVDSADLIFLSEAPRLMVKELGLPEAKVWNVGTKNFGANVGYPLFRRSGEDDPGDVKMLPRYTEMNRTLAQEWGDRYINLIEEISVGEGRVRVFTHEGKLLTQDSKHLTAAGAQFFAEELDQTLKEIFDSVEK